MLTFQISLSVNDYQAFLETVYLDTAKTRQLKQNTGMILFMALMSCFYTLILYLKEKVTTLYWIVTIFCFTYFIYLLLRRKYTFRFLHKIAAKTQAKNFTKNSDNQSFFDPKTYIISETGIQVSSPLSDGQIYWKGFVKRKDTPTHIILFVTQFTGFIFPKHKIPDMPAFGKMLDTHISFHAQVGNEIAV